MANLATPSNVVAGALAFAISLFGFQAAEAGDQTSPTTELPSASAQANDMAPCYVGDREIMMKVSDCPKVGGKLQNPAEIAAAEQKEREEIEQRERMILP